MEVGVTHLENISTWLNLLGFKLLSIKVALSQSHTEGEVTAITDMFHLFVHNSMNHTIRKLRSCRQAS
jgi:hypothetical protein